MFDESNMGMSCYEAVLLAGIQTGSELAIALTKALYWNEPKPNPRAFPKDRAKRMQRVYDVLSGKIFDHAPQELDPKINIHDLHPGSLVIYWCQKGRGPQMVFHVAIATGKGDVVLGLDRTPGFYQSTIREDYNRVSEGFENVKISIGPVL